MLHGEITERIIGSFFDVYNELGHGFLEKVYENALALSLRGCGLDVCQQEPITVRYKGAVVGEYFADLLVNRVVIVELKAVDQLAAAHEAQLLNYLKATNLEVGLLLNFGPSAEFRRKVMTNDS